MAIQAPSAKFRIQWVRVLFVGLALALIGPVSLAGAGEDFVPRKAPIQNSQNTALVEGFVPSAGAELFGFAMADFGGDSRPDLAAVELDRFDSRNADYRIYIRLTEGGEQNLRLTAPFGGLSITPRDVTGDGSLDLVISSSGSGDLLGIFVNDGKGHFDKAKPADFANDPGKKSSQYSLNTKRPYLITTFATLEYQAFDCRTDRIHLSRTTGCSLISIVDSLGIQTFLYFGANRAPPHLA